MGVVFGCRLDGGNFEGLVEGLETGFGNLVGYVRDEQLYCILVGNLDSVKGRWSNCDDSGVEI